MDDNSNEFDLTEFLDRLRSALQSPQQVSPEDLMRLINTYSQLVADANARLQECAVLVDKAQYANAVALSEREPNLISRCGMLDFRERPLLETIATQLSMAPPQTLKRHLGALLQDAYFRISDSGANLRLLHRLTLARAPLPTRIAVMRQLLIQNPNHPFLDNDIREFERTWFTQAHAFALKYAQADRLSIVAQVLIDLNEGGYFETPPSSLIASLAELLLSNRAARIRHYFVIQSRTELEPLLVEWRSITKSIGAKSNLDARFGVVEAFQWIDSFRAEETRYQHALNTRDNLWQLLQNPNTARRALERAYADAYSANGLDAELAQAYQQRIQQFDQTNKRKTIAIYGTACLVLLLLVGLLGSVLQANWRAKADISSANELENLLKEKKFEEARGFVERKKKSQPDFEKIPPVAPLIRTLEQKEAFDKALAEVSKCPGEIDADPLIKAARELAQIDAELKKVDGEESNWKLRREKYFVELKLENDKKELKNIELEKKIIDLESKEITPAKLAQLNEEISELRDKIMRDKLLQKFDVQKRMLEMRKIGRELDADLINAKPNLETLEKIATHLHDKVAPVAVDAEFAEILRKAPASVSNWKAALSLEAALQVDPVEAAVKSLNEWRGLPPEETLNAASRFSEMYSDRDHTKQGTTAFKVKAIFTKPEIKDLYIIRRQGAGFFHYTYFKEKIGKEGKQIDVIQNKSGIFSPIRFEDTEPQLAPHAFCAQTFNKFWGLSSSTGTKSSPANWHLNLAKGYEFILDQKKVEVLPVEPLVKLQLIRSILELADSGSEGYRIKLNVHNGFNAIMKESNHLEGDWFDPGLDEVQEKSLKEIKRKAETLMLQAPRLIEYAKAAAEYDLQFSSDLKRGQLLIGWLACDVDGRHLLKQFKGIEPVKPARLFVVVKGEWIEIGSVALGSVQLKTEIVKRYVGWPVFSLQTFPKN